MDHMADETAVMKTDIVTNNPWFSEKKKKIFSRLYTLRWSECLEINPPPTHIWKKNSSEGESCETPSVTLGASLAVSVGWLMLVMKGGGSAEPSGSLSTSTVLNRVKVWIRGDGGSGNIRETTTRQEIKLHSTADNSLVAHFIISWCTDPFEFLYS